MSSNDIGSGDAWQDRIFDQLASVDFGVLCVTPENLTSPWLLFEAGALAIRQRAGELRGACPLLVELPLREIPDTHPLRRFQMREANSGGIERLVRDITGRADGDEILLRAVFAYRQHMRAPSSEDADQREMAEMGDGMLAGQVLSAYHSARVGAFLAGKYGDERAAGEFRHFARVFATTPFRELPQSVFEQLRNLYAAIMARANADAARFGLKPIT